MDEWLNVLLRTLMCGLFIFWVVKPMLMTMARKELNMAEIDEMADTVTQAAFNAWQKEGVVDPLNDPQLALYMAEHPELQWPGPASLEEAQAHEQSLEDAQAAALTQAAEEAAAAQAAAEATALETAQTQAAAQETKSMAGEHAGAVSDDAATAGEGVSADASLVVTDAAPPEVEEDMGESLEEMKKRMKAEQKKAKPKIPTELLTNANSYEDKLVVVQMITDQDQNRVAMAIRNMIRGGM